MPAPSPAPWTGKLGSVARAGTGLSCRAGRHAEGKQKLIADGKNKGTLEKAIAYRKSQRPGYRAAATGYGIHGEVEAAANKWCSQLIAWHRIQEEDSLLCSSLHLRGL